MSLSDEQPRTRLVLPEEPDDGPFRPRRPRRPRWIGPLAVVIVFAIVLAVLAIVSRAGRAKTPAASSTSTTSTSTTRAAVTTGAPSHSASAAPPPPATTVSTTPFAHGSFPTSTVYDVPVGYADTRDGAVSAAVNYAVAYGSGPMAVTGTRHAILQAIADPAVLTSLQTQLDTAYAAFDRSMGLSADGAPPAGYSLVIRTLPVGQRVTSEKPSRITVSVWVDVLSGLSGTSTAHPVGEQWETLAVTVHRVDGDWKWAAFSETDGPTPVNSAQTLSGNDALKSAIEQFGGLRYAP